MKNFLSSLLSKFSGSKGQVGSGSCPECHSALQALPSLKVAVCDQCSGIWAPPAEVNTLLRVADSRLDHLLGKQVVAELTTASSAQRNCPQCRVPMLNYQFDERVELWLDACESGHGVWFDPGELDMAMEAVRCAGPGPGEQSVKMSINAEMSDLAIRIAVYFKYAEVVYQSLLVDLPHPIWSELGLLLMVKKVGVLFYLGSMPSQSELSELTEGHLQIFKDCELVITLMNDPKMQSHQSLALVTNLEFLTYCCCYYVTAAASSWSDISQKEAMGGMALLGRALEASRAEARDQADAVVAQARQKCPSPSSTSSGAQSGTFSCRRCDKLVTQGSQAIEINGQHVHSLANPQGNNFEVRLFSMAEGAKVVGQPVFKDSWFDGYGWSMALCSGCESHVGWHFQGENSSFFGLRSDVLRY